MEIFVLANGCTDSTCDVVRDYAHDKDNIRLVEIKMGDKSNAWNEFVYNHFLPGEICFFIDGDVWAAPGALSALHQGLSSNPNANAAAALPQVGRDRIAFRRMLMETGGIAGALYALRGDFLNRVRMAGLRLPIGFIGEDGLVGALVNWDLEPRKNQWDKSRIVPCPDAEFIFRSRSVFRPNDWIQQWRRLVNYALRAYQFQMLGPLLKAGGLEAMPGSVADLYALQAKNCSLKWEGINTIFKMLALQRIRRSINERS